MQGFINFVAKFRDYIAFTSLVIISLSLISLGGVSRLGGFRAFVIGSVGWMQELFAWIPNPGALRTENRAVRELNLELSSEVIRMRSALIENRRLRDMLNYKLQEQENILSAEIVGKNSIELRHYYTINKGVEDGIKTGMAVRTDAGLVGTVVGSHSNYALVESILNRNVRISGKIIRAGIDGIIIWDGSDKLLLKNIPESFDVQIGDIIITSNYSNKYPEEVPIGEVQAIEKDQSSLFLKIVIMPYVDFASVQQVFVVMELPDEERRKLILEMEEKLKSFKR